jgi:uncharacterized protein YrrD
MDMCDLETHENFSDMKQKSVKCSDGKSLGHITDVVFDNNLNVHSFILGGQLWDKIRKKFNHNHDAEHTITADKLDSVFKNEIKLLISKQQLKKEIQKDAILPTQSTYKSLRRKIVVDFNQQIIGKIVNMVFLPCGEVAFIITCLNPDTKGIPKGLGSKWDLLLPASHIDSVTESHIILSVSAETLEKTLNEHILDHEAAEKYLNSLKDKNVAEKRALVRAYDGFHMR